MKKLLILSTIPVPYRTTVFLGLAEHYDADIFFERSYDQNRNDKYFVEDKGFVLLNTEAAMRKYQNCLKCIEEYDLVLAYDYTSKMGMQLMMHCICNGVPYALNCDGAFVNKNWLKDRIKRFFVSRASLYFCSGASARAYFLHYGADESKMHYHDFTSLVESDIFNKIADSDEKNRLRQENNIPNKTIVLTIGQFIHRKGFDILLKSWKDVCGDAHLLIVGGGEKLDEYKAYISENSMDNVSIIGFLDKEKVFEYYRASDVFVLPTREDVWGLVINEAMACGIPVISSDMCIAGRELIEEDRNGYVVPVENAEALTKAIQILISDPEKRLKMGKNNIDKMQGNVMNNIVERHIEVIDAFLK